MISRLQVITGSSEGFQIIDVSLYLAKVVLTENLVHWSIQSSLMLHLVHLTIVLVSPVHCIDWTRQVFQLNNVLLDLRILMFSVDVIDGA